MRGARWCEVDFDRAIWTIPAERMKARQEHRVPLTPRAIEILEKVGAYRASELIFPNPQNRSLSTNAFGDVIKRLPFDTVTTHGFRSSFRDWAAEISNAPREIAEASLAHTLKNKSEAAYWLGDILEKRRLLLEACKTGANRDRPGENNVISLGKRPA